MTPTKRIAALITVAASLLAVSAAVPARADDATGRHFAERVRMHASEMGMSGSHNPGVMHQGFSGWGDHHSH